MRSTIQDRPIKRPRLDSSSTASGAMTDRDSHQQANDSQEASGVGESVPRDAAIDTIQDSQPPSIGVIPGLGLLDSLERSLDEPHKRTDAVANMITAEVTELVEPCVNEVKSTEGDLQIARDPDPVEVEGGIKGSNVDETKEAGHSGDELSSTIRGRQDAEEKIEKGNENPANPSSQTLEAVVAHLDGGLPQGLVTTRRRSLEVMKDTKHDSDDPVALDTNIPKAGVVQLEAVPHQDPRSQVNLSRDEPGKVETHMAGIRKTEEFEHPEWEADSSPIESSSEESETTSGSSSDDGSDADYPMLDPREQARILMAGEGGSDDEDRPSKKVGGNHLRTEHEVKEPEITRPDIQITGDMQVEELGSVESVVENIILIKAKTSGNHQVLESGSALCLENRTVIGAIAETLGRVQQPLYTVNFNSAAQIAEEDITVGIKIFYVVQHSSFIFTEPLRTLKGSDASNVYDEEVGADEIEFSDDEAEAEHKRLLKQQKLARKGTQPQSVQPRGRGGNQMGKGGRVGNKDYPSGEINYDDINDGEGYTLLARPTNLHEMMAGVDPPPESHSPSYSDRGNRGGRAGRGRDRGGRGRGRGDRRGGRGTGGSNPRSSGPSIHGQQQNTGFASLPPKPLGPPPADSVPLQNTQINSLFFNKPPPPFQQPPLLHSQHYENTHQSSYNSYQTSPPPGSHLNPAFYASQQQPRQQQFGLNPHQPAQQPQWDHPQSQNQWRPDWQQHSYQQPNQRGTFVSSQNGGSGENSYEATQELLRRLRGGS